MAKIWFDTEFHQYEACVDGIQKPVLDAICLGMVDQKGRTYEAVFNDFNLQAAQKNAWLAEHVLPKLPPQESWKSRREIRKDVMAFIGRGQTEFRYWFAPQDAVILQSVFATNFLDQPEHISGFPFNIAQRFNALSAPESMRPPKDPQAEHGALYDAAWAKSMDEALDKYAQNLP